MKQDNQFIHCIPRIAAHAITSKMGFLRPYQIVA